MLLFFFLFDLNEFAPQFPGLVDYFALTLCDSRFLHYLIMNGRDDLINWIWKDFGLIIYYYEQVCVDTWTAGPRSRSRLLLAQQGLGQDIHPEEWDQIAQSAVLC